MSQGKLPWFNFSNNALLGEFEVSNESRSSDVSNEGWTGGVSMEGSLVAVATGSSGDGSILAMWELQPERREIDVAMF